MRTRCILTIILINFMLLIFLFINQHRLRLLIEENDKKIERVELSDKDSGYEKKARGENDYLIAKKLRLLEMKMEVLESKFNKHFEQRNTDRNFMGEESIKKSRVFIREDNVDYLEKANDICDKIENGEELSPVELMAYDVIRKRLTDEELLLLKGNCYE